MALNTIEKTPYRVDYDSKYYKLNKYGVTELKYTEEDLTPENILKGDTADKLRFLDYDEEAIKYLTTSDGRYDSSNFLINNKDEQTKLTAAINSKFSKTPSYNFLSYGSSELGDYSTYDSIINNILQNGNDGSYDNLISSALADIKNKYVAKSEYLNKQGNEATVVVDTLSDLWNKAQNGGVTQEDLDNAVKYVEDNVQHTQGNAITNTALELLESAYTGTDVGEYFNNAIALEYYIFLEQLLSANYKPTTSERFKSAAKSIFGNVVGGLSYVPETIATSIAKGEFSLPNSGGISSTILTNAQKEQQKSSQGMSDAGQFFWNTGISIASNLVNMALTGGSGTGTAVIMGIQAGSSTANEAANSGATQTQILLKGITSGLLETLTEFLPQKGLENIIKQGVSGSTLSVFKRLLAQSLTEFNEETINEVGSIIADLAIMKDQSEMVQYFNQYLKDHPDASNNKALWNCLTKGIKQVLEAGAAGAISGGALAGGGYIGNISVNTLSNTINQNKSTKANLKSQVNSGSITKETAKEIYKQQKTNILETYKSQRTSGAMQSAINIAKDELTKLNEKGQTYAKNIELESNLKLVNKNVGMDFKTNHATYSKLELAEIVAIDYDYKDFTYKENGVEKTISIKDQHQAVIDGLRNGNLSSDILTTATNLSKITGVNVVFSNNAYQGTGFNYNGNTLVISTTRGINSASLIEHEYVHYIARKYPDAFNRLLGVINSNLDSKITLGDSKKTITLKEALTKAKESYFGKDANINFNNKDDYEEIVARFIELFLNDRKATSTRKSSSIFAQMLGMERRSMLRNLIKTAKSLGNFANRLGKGGTELYNATIDIRNEIEKLLSTPVDKTIDAYLKNKKVDGVNGIINENGILTRYSYDSYNEKSILLNGEYYSGKELLVKTLKENGFTKSRIDTMLEDIDEAMDIATELEDKFKSLKQFIHAKPYYRPDGNLMLTCLISNGEYELNIDFSTICKKRESLSMFLTEYVETNRTFGKDGFNEANQTYLENLFKKYGLDTACSICFVEARRKNVERWSRKFESLWSKALETAKITNIKPISEIKDLKNINTIHGITDAIAFDVANLIEAEALEESTEIAYRKRYEERRKKNPDAIVRPDTYERMQEYLTKHIKDGKIWSIKKSDLLNTKVIAYIRAVDPDLYSILLTSYGANAPKQTLPAAPYASEVLASKDFLRYSDVGKHSLQIGGVRLNSFSDFQITRFLDYIQLVADAESKSIAMQTYAKELAQIEILGKSGLKQNMSIIPEVDIEYAEQLKKDGKNPKDYAGLNNKGEFIVSTDSVDVNKAFELQEQDGIKGDCGTCLVGISKFQILKALADSRIKMIIPYHTSGMPKHIKIYFNHTFYTDYQGFQNTMDQNMVKLKVDPFMSVFYSEYEKDGNYLAATQKYLDYCKKNNLVPRFAMKWNKALSFEENLALPENYIPSNPNYYKVLIDFTSDAGVDANGNQIFKKQQPVKLNLKGIDLKGIVERECKLLEDGYKKYNSVKDKMMEEFQNAVNGKVSVAEQKAIRDQRIEVENKTNVIKDDIKHSMETDSDGNLLTQEQADFFKNSKVRDENGKLKMMYHTTENYGFDSFSNTYSNGFYFTDSKEMSQSYSPNTNETYSVYLNIENPYIIDAKNKNWNEIVDENDNNTSLFNKLKENKNDVLNNKYISIINKLGYDAEYYDQYNDSIYYMISKNGKELGDVEYVDDFIRLIEENDETAQYDNDFSYSGLTYQNTRSIFDKIKNTNYDGVIIKNVSDWGGRKGIKGKEYNDVVIAKYPNQIKNIDNTNPTLNDDIRYSQESDKEYMDAVNNNDLKTAKKLVKMAARKAGYTQEAWHGTTSYGFTIFNTDPLKNNTNVGSHFGSKYAAKEFANGEFSHGGKNIGIYHVYLNLGKVWENYDMFAQGNNEMAINAVELIKEINTRESEAIFDEIKEHYAWLTKNQDDNWWVKDDNLEWDHKDDPMLYRNFRKLLRLAGYDSISYQNTLEDDGNIDYVILDPSQVKSAEPVVYDKDGNVIPLSERFNIKNDDIRYSIELEREDRDVIENNIRKDNNYYIDLEKKAYDSFVRIWDKDKYDSFENYISKAPIWERAINIGRDVYKNNYAYHAGDLDKSRSDDYDGQYGARVTGHFGYGTYFVGDEEQINTLTYGQRPHHKVNFDNYNLWKPKDTETGYNVHTALKYINNERLELGFIKKLKNDYYGINYIEYEEIPKQEFVLSFEDPNWRKLNAKNIHQYCLELKDFVNKYKIEHRPYSEIKKETVDTYNSWYNKQPTNTEIEQEIADSLRDNVKDWYDNINKRYRYFADIVKYLYEGLRKPKSQILDALEKTYSYRNSMRELEYPNQKGKDSASTFFMKELGFEGVDVRETELDNTGYGSVIYNLRPESIVYSKESDSQGNQLSIQQQEYFANSKVRDNDGNLQVVYHGTTKGGFNVFKKVFLGSTTNSRDAQIGFHFTNNKDVAEMFSKYNFDDEAIVENGEIKELYLNITKPLDITNLDRAEQIGKDITYIITGSYDLNGAFESYADVVEQLYQGFNNIVRDFKLDLITTKGAMDRLVELGYDGLILPTTESDNLSLIDVDKFENRKTQKGGKEYIIFESNQAKNITNLNPTGNEDIRYSTEDYQITHGININDSTQPFTEQILNGEKTIETRNSRSLDAYIGKRVGIIRTGKGKAMLVGSCVIGDPIVYNSKKEFDADYNKHLVGKNSKFYINDIKYGYPLLDVKRYNETPVDSKGIISRKLNESIKYSKETNSKILKELNNVETKKVYRSMQLIDGKLYPPMAAKMDGKLVDPLIINEWYRSDERPDLAVNKNGKKDENGGYFILDKGNGKKIIARYNPYYHTTSSPLNDQFSSAYLRPNLVVVEGEIPVSELTSEYRAEKAKDSVGEKKWHSGVVSSKLGKSGKPRTVILSRWFKANRIIDNSEVAQKILDVLDGENIVIPYNVVTPLLKNELEKLGVKIGYEYEDSDIKYSKESETTSKIQKAISNVAYDYRTNTLGIVSNESIKELAKLIIEEAPTIDRQYIDKYADDLANDLINKMSVIDADSKYGSIKEVLSQKESFDSYKNKIKITDELKSEIKNLYDKDAKTINLLWSGKNGISIEDVKEELSNKGINFTNSDVAGDIMLDFLNYYDGLREYANLYNNGSKDSATKKWDSNIIEEIRNDLRNAITNIIDPFVGNTKLAEKNLEKKASKKIQKQYDEALEKLKQETSEKLENIKKQATISAEKKAAQSILDLRNVLEKTTAKAKEIVEKSNNLRKEMSLQNKIVYNIYQISSGKVDSSIAHNEEFLKSIAGLKSLTNRGNLTKAGIRSKIGQFGEWYREDNPLLDNLYDPAIKEAIDSIMDNNVVRNKKGEIRVNKDGVALTNREPLSMNELRLLDYIVQHAKKLIQDFDTEWKGEQRVKITEEAEKANNIAIKYQDLTKKNKFAAGMSTYGSAIVEPRVVIEGMFGYQSNPMSEFYEEITQGENKASYITWELNNKINEYLKEHKEYRKSLKEKVKFNGVEITKAKLLSIYKLYEQQHSRDALILNGFGFRDKNKYWQKMDVLTEESINELKSLITPYDEKFLEIVAEFFETGSKYQIETDIKLKGYSTINPESSKYYFPINRKADDRAKSFDESYMDAMNMNSIANMSITKKRVQNMKQIEVYDIDEVLDRYSRQVGKYAGLAVPIKAFQRLYNTNINKNINKPTSLRNTLNESVWNKSGKYLTKLMADIQGIGREKGIIESTFGKIRGAYAKYQLGANIKVIMSQMASFPTAFTDLKLSSMSKVFLHKIDFKEMDKYCKWAFNRNVGNEAVKSQTLVDKWNKATDVFQKPISWSDRFTIGMIWNACQFEIESNHKGDDSYKFGTEKNKIEAGKLLEQVGRKTQPNYTQTERTQLQRTQNEILKTFAMFTAVPSKQISRLVESFGEANALIYKKRKLGETLTKEEKQRVKKKLAKTITAVTIANLVYILMGQLVKHMFDKDREDKDGNEISIGMDMLKDFGATTIGMLPFVKDIYSHVVDGYDIDAGSFLTGGLTDMIQSTYQIGKYISDLANGDVSSSTKLAGSLKSLSYALGTLTGIPTRNIYNTISGTIKRFDDSTYYKMQKVFTTSNYLTKLSESDNDDLSVTIINEKLKDNGIGNENVSKELLEIYKNTGNITYPQTLSSTITYKGKEYKLSNSEYNTLRKQYSNATSDVEELINSSEYQALTYEQKAKAINYIYDAYYNDVLNKYLNINIYNGILPNACSITLYATSKAYLSTLESDKDKDGNTIAGSKKEKFVTYVMSLNMSTAQKMFMIALNGYTLTGIPNKTQTQAEALCKKFIDAQKISDSQKQILYKKCGIE